jgi:hypothetical protein
MGLGLVRRPLRSPATRVMKQWRVDVRASPDHVLGKQIVALVNWNICTSTIIRLRSNRCLSMLIINVSVVSRSSTERISSKSPFASSSAPVPTWSRTRRGRDTATGEGARTRIRFVCRRGEETGSSSSECVTLDTRPFLFLNDFCLALPGVGFGISSMSASSASESSSSVEIALAFPFPFDLVFGWFRKAD